MPDVPSCPVPVATNAIKNAAIEFCALSNILRVTTDPVTTTASEKAYTIDVDNGLVPVRAMVVWFNGKIIGPLGPGQVDLLNASPSTPEAYIQTNPDEVILVPAPLTPGTLVIEASAKPSRASIGVEKWIHETYLDDIASGAKSRLMAMPKKPWSNGNLADYHRKMFELAAASASILSSKGFNRAPLRSTPVL